MFYSAQVDFTLVFNDAYLANLSDPTTAEYAAMAERANAALAQLLNGTNANIVSIQWIFSPGSVVAEAPNTGINGVSGNVNIAAHADANTGAVSDSAFNSSTSGVSK